MFVDLQGPPANASDHAGLLFNLARAMADSAQRYRQITLLSLTREALAFAGDIAARRRVARGDRGGCRRRTQETVRGGIADILGLTVGHLIATLADRDARRQARALEGVVAGLEVAPEVDPLMALIALHGFVGRTEGKDVHVEALLPLLDRGAGERKDLGLHLLCHGVAADRRAATMHEDMRPGAAVDPVERVGKAEIDCFFSYPVSSNS